MSDQGRGRRAKARRLLLGAPVAVVGLALSGCVWATVAPLDEGAFVVGAKNNVSNQVIKHCNSAHPGDAGGRAVCALDAVAQLCATQDVHNWYVEKDYKLDPATCHQLSSHTNSADMQRAISQVLGPDKDCLAWESQTFGPNFWFAVQATSSFNYFGCDK